MADSVFVGWGQAFKNVHVANSGFIQSSKRKGHSHEADQDSRAFNRYWGLQNAHFYFCGVCYVQHNQVMQVVK